MYFPDKKNIVLFLPDKRGDNVQAVGDDYDLFALHFLIPIPPWPFYYIAADQHLVMIG